MWNIKTFDFWSAGTEKRLDKPFRFLDLPAELREQILQHAVTEDEGIEIHKLLKWDWWRYRDPAISLVSRQLRNESLHLFYRENIFESQSHGDLLWFMSKLKKEKLALIKDLRYTTSTLSLSFLEQFKAWVEEMGEIGLRPGALKLRVNVLDEGEVWCGLDEVNGLEKYPGWGILKRKR